MGRGVGFLRSVLKQGTTIQHIDAFHKMPLALAVAGHSSEARALVRWIRSRSHPGEFASQCLRDARRPFLRSYYMAWLALGAQEVRAANATDQALSAMLEYQNSDFGGFYTDRRPEGGVMHFVVTSVCGYACLRLRRLAEAVKAGEFVLAMVKGQPDPTKLYFRFDSQKGLILRYPVDSRRRRQPYHVVGSGLLFLSELYRATHRRRFLEGARALFDFGLLCQSDILHSLPSSKFGWGSSALYRIQGNARERKVAEHIAHHLMRTQGQDGSWSVLRWPVLSEIPRFWRYIKTSLAAEYVITLCMVTENLGQNSTDTFTTDTGSSKAYQSESSTP